MFKIVSGWVFKPGNAIIRMESEVVYNIKHEEHVIFYLNTR